LAHPDTTEPVPGRSRAGFLRMRDVAEMAGVSAITVSRALNQPDKVAAATRARVEDVVRRIGYVPNGVAGTLVSNRSRVVAALVPTIRQAIFAETLRGLGDTLRERGYQIMLSETDFSSANEEDLVAAALSQRPAALVLTGLTHTPRSRAMLANAGIPVVETWCLGERPIDTIVGFSNRDASYAMTRTLIDAGYRTIAFVGAPTADNDRAHDRVHGYRQALSDAGLSHDPSLEVEFAYGLANGAAALSTLLARNGALDAIFIASDVLAAGAILEGQRRGIAVPGDLAIAGFDDQEIARQINPALTTVRLRLYEIGVQVAKQILHRLERPDAPPACVDTGFEIVVREST